MATPPVKQWGTTPPISSALPTPDELVQNDNLLTELKQQNNFEAPVDTERRKQTLQLIQRVTLEFVRIVSRKKGLSQAAIDAAGGKIFTFGSYRLGVYGPGSDIDTLVVGPKHVAIEDFFSDFPVVLEQMAPKDAIEKLTPVPEAFVPIIKLEFSGISIDLIYARLAVHSVPLSLDLKDNDLLRGLNDTEIRCVNGTRVTDLILEVVPQQKTFRVALRAIKLWAQRRAIYGNVMGFPGGVAWAMLVARVCQLYPQATGSVIVSKFFRILTQWKWPQPVLLRPIEDGPLHVRVWNPNVYPDSRHLMPIITPAYPSMCATHNISLSTKAVILREFTRAGDIVERIFTGSKQWNDLFARHTFFSQDYKYYLSVTASSTTKEAQSVWSGLVESKLRHLVGALDRKPSIEIAHPFAKGFERVHSCRDENGVRAVQSGSTQYLMPGTKTETTDATNDPTHAAAAENGGGSIPIPESAQSNETDDRHLLYTTTYYIGLELKPLAPDISNDAQLFRSTCTSWPQYREGVNDLSITHIRNYDLPDDVFQPGEVKPSRPKKKVVKRASPTGQKRRIDDVDTEQPSESVALKRRMSANGVTATATPA